VDVIIPLAELRHETVLRGRSRIGDVGSLFDFLAAGGV
jgi:hypothetical protein